MLSKLFQSLKKKKPIREASAISDVEVTKSKVTSSRIGELGEYKINIQLDQLPKNARYLSDVLIPNVKAKSGYSQIDHVVFTPFAIFVIETKNFAGTIYGDRKSPKWNVNGKFYMMNPFNQNFGHIQAIKSILQTVDERDIVSIVSFTKRSAFKVNAELRKIQSNDLIVYDTELSEFMTRKLNVLKLQHPSAIFSDDNILHMYSMLEKTNISDQGIRTKHVEMLSTKARITAAHESQINAATCMTCGKAVSGKVEAFCLANKKRFKGNIYCYDHQKAHA
ncbi:nuclease-related domain-containing protein [Peribacillus sp. SI8-4]|uniref:nuclease-related domain-containing protein n=1 Tax=Peribacillus sp. SI8-4 TaxID=3048009 RepID=UPI0025574171|nr:nuclease-related domain-containing protein [Peribacillus sp. SI8-4]